MSINTSNNTKIYNWIRRYSDKTKTFYPSGCIVGVVNHKDTDNQKVLIGISLCHKNDKFDKSLAIDLATRRALNQRSTYTLGSKFPDYSYVDIKPIIDEFVIRCVKYFKLIPVVYPKNIKFIK